MDQNDQNTPSAAQDELLTCVMCGDPYVWTAREQHYYAAHGLLQCPKRCRACRAERRATGGRGRDKRW